MREYTRDTRRDEDRGNMALLMEDLRRLRRDENGKNTGFRINARNTRIIKKKDIRQVRNKKDLNKISPSKRMIFKSQGIVNK